VRSWTQLLRSAVAEPESRVLEVPLLAPAERLQLVVDWNDTALRFPSEDCIHRWIEAQAARTPEAAAVRFEGRELTYADLNARANRLARHLQDLGVGPDRAVGICVNRSLEMCVGVLAVLKSGGAYVPLDPSLPAERLAFMAEDVASSLGMPVLLTQSRLLEQAARWAVPATAVVLLDGAPGALASDDGNLEDAPAADNLAYVIYTSGTTGHPKGVMVPHSGLLNYLLWSAEAYGASAGTGSLVHSALGFDLTVTSLFVPLLAGRTVELVPEGDGVEQLAAALLASRDLTLLKLTPSHFEALRGYLPAEEVAGRVRMLVIGGESLRGESLDFWFEHAPGTRLMNEYGPTETVVGCSTYEPGPSTRGTVSIGRPMANVHMVVLGRWLELVPLGAIGELYIGGACVTRGYLGRPELTAEKFVPNAFSETPGARLYRSGDLARCLPDGRFQFLGRTDHQVKIRGFRIELGEIEKALAELPGVRQAVVLAREGPQGDRRLAAWIVTGEETLTPGDLRQRLRSRLPEHMVPTELCFLDSLPLTPTGKVDRRALPAPDASVRTGRASAAPPRDEVEHRLVEIWAEILGLESVGVDESFFELGGHSLSAVRLMARIEDQFGQALPLSAIFQAATVERMASLLRTGAPDITSTQSVVVKLQGGSRRPFFCVHPVGGNVFCYVSLAHALGREQPFYGLQVPDLSSAPAETLDTIEGMSRRYIEAMREVQPTGPYRLGGWSMGAVVAFEMARQLRRADEEVELVAMLDAPVPGAQRRAEDLDRSSILADFARDLAGGLLPVGVEELRQLDYEKQLAQVLEWAKETGALPAGENLDRLAGLFATFERNVAALGRYEPVPYPGRIELFRASDTAARRPDPGWTGLAHGGVAIHEVPGDHYSIIRRPALLAGRLKVFLER
jgi:amino acid adenylation domain-containing protein